MNGIYIASCDEKGGIYYLKNNGTKLEVLQKTDIDRPMFLAIEGDKLYAVLRAPFENSDESGLISYDILPDGTLENPSEIIPTGGEVACHLSVLNGNVYAANYVSGSIIKFPDKLIKHSGSGPNLKRQESAHTHFIYPHDGAVYVCDLGMDKIFVYDKDLELLKTYDVPCGFGARHLAFSDDFMYCVNELSSTVSVFKKFGNSYDYLADYSAIPDGFNGENTAAAIRICGKYVYVSNRGHDSIACMRMEGEGLVLEKTVPCGGKVPRDINILGDIMFCANQDSDTVTALKITDSDLSLTEDVFEVKTPLCITFA